jgi:hypothetical protein
VALVKVAAIIVTRGDQWVALRESVLPSLPEDWDVLVWDNGAEVLIDARRVTSVRVSDLSVYGRYASIEYTDADLIYVQDDDCIVSAPIELDTVWMEHAALQRTLGEPWNEHVVCNMPPEFRHDFYTDHALVGFGAVFHRDAPARAFLRYAPLEPNGTTDFFLRTCDIVFTALTPRVLVDVPKENLPYAYHYDRMWRQPEHQAERARMLELLGTLR